MEKAIMWKEGVSKILVSLEAPYIAYLVVGEFTVRARKGRTAQDMFNQCNEWLAEINGVVKLQEELEAVKVRHVNE